MNLEVPTRVQSVDFFFEIYLKVIDCMAAGLFIAKPLGAARPLANALIRIN